MEVKWGSVKGASFCPTLGGVNLPAKASVFTEEEVASLATQLTFDEAFEDLRKQEFAADQIDARIDRDKELIKYFLSKQTDAIGAVKVEGDSAVQYELTHGGYEIVAKEGSSRTTIDHEGLWDAIEERRKYYEAMVDRYQAEMDQAATLEERDSKEHYMEMWQTRLEAAKDMIDLRQQFSKTSSSDNLSLKITQVKVGKKKQSAKRKSRKDDE